MWSMLPNEAMYPYTAKEARDRGELELWRANFRTNCACAGAIELAIHRDFDGMHLKDGCAKSVIDQYGYMAASKNMIALEINGLHVHLTFAPFPAYDTVATVRAILKNSYVRTLQA